MSREHERNAGEPQAPAAPGDSTAADRSTAPGDSAAPGGSAASHDSAASRRRGAKLEDALLDAAWDVLLEHGYHGFTFEAVATRAGTSRPVLYRRWPHRDALLLATLTRYWRPIALPDTGNLRDDAIGFLRNADADRAGMITLMSVQLVDYFQDTGTSLGELRDTLLPPGHPTAFETIVARAVRRGELPDVPRPPRVLNLPLDLLRHDLFMTMRPVPDEAIEEIVDDVWLPLLRAPGTA